MKCVSFTTGHFCNKIYYFPLKFLAQFSASVLSFTGILVSLCHVQSGLKFLTVHSVWTSIEN